MMTPFSVIQILSCIIAGFYSEKWLAECSNLLKIDDPLEIPVSPMSEEVSNLEITTLYDYDGRIEGSAPDDLLEYESIISESLFENVFSDNADDKKSHSKRDVIEGNWTHANKMQILQLHNLYRSNVTPPAGNMAYMEWDTELERMAQIWANNCKLEHGGHENHTSLVGQNLDIDSDPTGYYALYKWYEERRNYDLRTGHCVPNKMCGHYVQMAWAESTKLGCAVAECKTKIGPQYYVFCNYSPAALHGVPSHRVAEPCSQCSGKNILCLKNLCVTPKQCKNNPFACEDAKCNLKCHNCGHLDNETCTCECADGWDSRDCSQLCKDKDKKCGKNPGFPNKNFCSRDQYAVVANSLCRKMCETCHAMQETSNNTCCGSKMCGEGYVIDPSGKSCECVLLCPGPICVCRSFEIKEDMSIVYSESNKGTSVATFSCHNNTKLIGSNTSECQPDGKWSLSSPYCEEITCSLFQTGKNMSVEYSEKNKVYSVATFSCPNSMKLIGLNTSECQYDGKWSTSLPYCEDEEEIILNLASIGGGTESLRTFPHITIWMVILKLLELYLHKHT